VEPSSEEVFRDLETRLDASLSRVESAFAKHKDEQTNTLVLTFIVMNATFVLVVALLAFFATRVG
jgi:hypothetical protein